jgi:ribulose-phosphate 3-epimerase
MQITPAIFEKDYGEVEKKLDVLKEAGVKTVQIDVCDDKFSPGESFDLSLLNNYQFALEFVWEIHLMVDEPVKWLEKCREIGALRVYGQVEKMADRLGFLNTAHEMGFEAGLAFDIDTPLDEENLLELDGIIMLARKAGFEPKKLDEKIFEKIKIATDLQEKLGIPFSIAIDGGIEEEHIARLRDAGVDEVNCTHIIFEGNVIENLARLKSI